MHTMAVDPELVEILGRMPLPTGQSGGDPIAALRSANMGLESPPPDVRVDQRTTLVPGALGDPDVEVSIYRPVAVPNDVALPGYIWIHGGGYVAGTHRNDRVRLEGLVATVGCVAVSVEYRLAPETPYPGPLEDCFAALSYVVAHAGELGVNPDRVAVGGASAGGGLAAGLALLARDRGVPIVHQHLIYPMIDDRMTTASSGWNVPVWSPAMNAIGWRAYLGALFGSENVPIYAAPARAQDLVGLPPTYIHVGVLDGFLLEDMDYASRLLSAGVATELHVFPGAPHGFDSFAPGSTLGRRARELSTTALAKFLTP
jgi:acetyl esterase/lipase